MARSLKPYVIETYKDHKSGMSVDIMYDRDNKDHFAHVGGETFRHDAFGEVKRKVAEALKNLATMKWFAVIEVEISSWTMHGKESATLSFSADRFFLSTRADRVMNECPWEATDSRGEMGKWKKFSGFEIPDDVKLRNANIRYSPNGPITQDMLPCRENREAHTDRGTYLVEYTESKWAALEKLKANIILLRQKLVELLGSEDGMKRLESAGIGLIGTPQLPAPTPAEPRRAKGKKS